MPVELRPYQREAVKTILANLREHSVAFQAPTGSGKTLIALEVAKELGSSSVFTRTLSEYMPWERDCRKLDMTFGGLAGKERFCLKPQVKLDSSV
ncbi:MAG: DEAD/DEAH box helicase family protein, partial [Candidatus Marsarchaeota archaeon]